MSKEILKKKVVINQILNSKGLFPDIKIILLNCYWITWMFLLRTYYSAEL